jgi:hypothetical protein
MTRYQYLKIPGYNNPVTIAYQVSTGPGDSSLLMMVGVAICHEKDIFSKDFGRRIAEGRMKKSPHYVAFANLDTSLSFGKRIVNSIHSWFDSSWKSLLQDP